MQRTGQTLPRQAARRPSRIPEHPSLNRRCNISKLTGRFPRLSLIWADGGYAGKLIEWVATLTGWTLEIVRRPGNRHRFEVLPRRWVVERTFAWLGRRRRLSKDYEALPETTEAWVYTAMTGLMLRRLARPPSFLNTL